MACSLRFSYLLIGQIARRIGRPQIAGGRLGPHPEVAPADVQPAAGGAAPGHVGPLVLELAQHRVAGVGPDLAEGPLAHVAQLQVPPELVRVHLAVPGHAPDAPPRAVALVPVEELQHLGGPLRVLAQKP